MWEMLKFLIIFIILHESPKGYILWIHWTLKAFIKLEATGEADFFFLFLVPCMEKSLVWVTGGRDAQKPYKLCTF